MPPETICQHLFISGRVQGVGYRIALESTARGLQVDGWVRNCRDGRVEALVQGLTPAVEALVHWCHRGPSAARVETVNASLQPVDPALTALHCIATA